MVRLCLASWLVLAPPAALVPSHAASDPHAGSEAPDHIEDVASDLTGVAMVGFSSCFIPNRGQWPESTLFSASFPGALVRVEQGAIGLQLLDGSGSGVYVRLFFVDASNEVEAVGEEDALCRHAWFIGNDPARWQCDVPSYERVRLRDLYPGIDLVLRRSESGSLKYDLELERGSDLAQVKVRVEGIVGLELETCGELRIETAARQLKQPVGFSWSVAESGNRSAQTSCVLLDEHTFGFLLEEGDEALPLVIDPDLIWSTFLGSSSFAREEVTALDLTRNGDVVVTGLTGGPAFPTTPGTFQAPNNLHSGFFVARFRGHDGALLFSTLIGAGLNDRVLDLAVDALGRATLVGFTQIANFPTTPGSFDTVRNAVNSSSGVVVRLSSAGTDLEYSTFLEGAFAGTHVWAVDVHPDGAPIVGGLTSASDFPVTQGAFDTSGSTVQGGSAFVAHLDVTGTSLLWSTFLGGSRGDHVRGLALDEQANVTVIGLTSSPDFPTTPGAFQESYPTCIQSAGLGFVTRLKGTGDALVWSTYFGGCDWTEPVDLAIDRLGGVVIGGNARSINMPVTPGAIQPFWNNPALLFEDGFVARLDSKGSSLVFSTYLGDVDQDRITGVAVDASGVVTIAGWGGLIPTTPGAYDTTFNAGDDMLIARIRPDGTRLLYSTYLGGSEEDQVFDLAQTARGRVTVAGRSYYSLNYPVTPGAYDTSFNGGEYDAVITTLELYHAGTRPVGDSTPACLGPVLMNATSAAISGTGDFAFYCSGAPPSTAGYLLVGLGLDPNGRDVGGARMWVSSRKRMARIPVVSDAEGFVWTPWGGPLPQIATQVYAQYLFKNPPECPGAALFSASDALEVAFQ